MRFRLTFIYILFTPILVAAQEEYTELPQVVTPATYGIDGKVKSIYKIKYDIALQERQMGDTTEWTDTVLTKRIETTRYFDSIGRQVKVVTDSFDDKGKIELNTIKHYYYNSDNRLLAFSSYEDGKLKDSAAVEYDRRDKDEIEEISYYDKKARLTRTVEFFYRNDRIFNVKLRNPDRSLQNFIRYKYFKGRLWVKEVQGNTMQRLYSLRYEYDTLDNGRFQVNKYVCNGRYHCNTLYGELYSPNGKLLERTVTDSNKRMVEYGSFRYNEKGLLETETIFANESKIDNLYSYEYDDKGYWRTVRINDKGIPARKVHRVIEYYKEEEL